MAWGEFFYCVTDTQLAELTREASNIIMPCHSNLTGHAVEPRWVPSESTLNQYPTVGPPSCNLRYSLTFCSLQSVYSFQKGEQLQTPVFNDSNFQAFHLHAMLQVHAIMRHAILLIANKKKKSCASFNMEVLVMGMYDQIQPHDTPILDVDSDVYHACETLNNFQC